MLGVLLPLLGSLLLGPWLRLWLLLQQLLLLVVRATRQATRGCEGSLNVGAVRQGQLMVGHYRQPSHHMGGCGLARCWEGAVCLLLQALQLSCLERPLPALEPAGRGTSGCQRQMSGWLWW